MTRVTPTGAFALGYLTDCDPMDEAACCESCGEPSALLTEVRCWYSGNVRGRWCPACVDADENQEPGDDSCYDGGSTRHELQDASGAWRR